MATSMLNYADPVATKRAKDTQRLTYAIETRMKSDYLESAEDWDPAINNEDLKFSRVTISHLDLEKPSSMVQPQSVKTVTEWLDEAKPGEYLGFGSGFRDMEDEKTPWWNAHYLAGSLYNYVCGEHWYNKGIMSSHTLWQSCRTYSLVSHQGRMWFEMNTILVSKDKSLPHITGIFTQNYEPQDDRITTMELTAIAYLTDCRIYDEYLEKNEYIPVTLISFGGCNARVIHGYFDGPNLSIRLQMSKVMNFEKAGDLKKDDWKHLIGWLLATPLRSDGTRCDKPIASMDYEDNISEESEE